MYAVNPLGLSNVATNPWLLHWLNHGRHLTAFATYRYELSGE